MSEPYWLGADISFARSQEARGIQYKNKEGEPRECTALMKELGLNAISLRVWVNPKPWVRPGQPTLDPSDPAYHIGLCDKEDVLAKALVAKEQGMEILLSFHFSDTWSDPEGQQALIDLHVIGIKFYLSIFTTNVTAKIPQISPSISAGISGRVL